VTWMSSSWQLAPHSRRRAASSAARSGAPGGASSMQTSSRPAARSTGATSAAASAVAHTATARTAHDSCGQMAVCSTPSPAYSQRWLQARQPNRCLWPLSKTL